MAIHLRIVNGGIDTVDRAWDCVHDMLASIRCPGDPGGDICTQLCIYAFRCVQIVVYDVGGCHMDMVIDCEEVD